MCTDQFNIVWTVGLPAKSQQGGKESYCRETGHILIKIEKGCEAWWLIPVIAAVERLW